MALAFTAFSSIDPRPTDWLWPGRIPLGAITLLDGDPSTNKSTLTCEIAARVTTGRSLYGSTDAIPVGDVLLFQAEDQPGQTRRNLEAAHADLARVHRFGESSGSGGSLRLPQDIDALEVAVQRKRAKLIGLDPVTVYFGSSANSESAVRRITTPLTAMAERTGAAVLLVRHLRKSGSANALYRGYGSIAIAGAARSGLLIAVDPSDSSRRILAQYKSNLGPPSPSLLFSPKPINGGLTVDWLGESPRTAQELTANSSDGTSALDEAKLLLYSLLAEGPLLANDVIGLASDQGVAQRTLRRAKMALGVVSKRVGFGPGSKNFWVLMDNDAVKTIRDLVLAELADDLVHGSPLDGISPTIVEPSFHPPAVDPPDDSGGGIGLADGNPDDDPDTE